MANLLAETGVNVYQHFETQTPTAVEATLPACIVGQLYQMKYNEPVTVSDTTVFSATDGVFDINTRFLDTADLPNTITTQLKVLVSSPAALAGVYDIEQVDLSLNRIKIKSVAVVPSIGANNVQFSIYDPNKSYRGYGMQVKYPGILKVADADKAPVVAADSVVVKISDINGDHKIAGAATKATVEGAEIVVNGNVVKLVLPNSSDITGLTVKDCFMPSDEDLPAFFRISAINLAKEKANITCKAGSALLGGEYFSVYGTDGVESKVWYEVSDEGVAAGVAPTGTSVVKVAIDALDTAAQVADKTKTAMVAALSAKFNISNAAGTAVVAIENVAYGNTTNVQDGSVATTFTFSIAPEGEKSVTIVPENGATVSNVSNVAGSFKSSGFIATESNFILTPGIPYKGTIKVSYKAARRDVCDQIVKLQYISELKSFAGTSVVDDPENPLVAGMYLAMTNAGETVQIYGLAISSDTADGHAAAIEVLANKKEAYSVTPLTMDPSYVEMYKNHVLAVSSPEERWESIAFLSGRIPTYSTLTSNGSSNGPALANVSITAGASNQYELNNVSEGNDFFIYGITTSNLVRLTLFNTATKVKSVIECPVAVEPSLADKTKVVMTTNGATLGDFSFPSDLSTIAVYKYEVISEKFETASTTDKARQAQELVSWLTASASSIASSDGNSTRRIIYVLPDKAEMATSLGNRTVDGCFVAAAAAGLKSALAPHLPMAENAISGFNKVFRGTDYFSNIQIRTIESAGAMIFYQPNEASAPRARRDITNDVSTVKTMSLGTVSVIDLFAKRLRAALSPLTAKNVLNDNMLNITRTFTGSIISEFSEKGWWKGAEIKEVGISKTASDRTYAVIKPDTWDPYNGSDFHLYI